MQENTLPHCGIPLDKAYFQQVLNQFGLDGKAYSYHTLHQGLINDSYILKEGDTPVYLLQRINEQVFPDVEGLMGNVQTALSFLESDSYHRVSLATTSDGLSYCRETDGKYWRLMGFLEGSVAHNTCPNTTLAHEAGKIVGEFHSLLQAAPKDKFVDTIPNFHSLSLRKQQFQVALQGATDTRMQAAANTIAFATEMLPELLAFPHEGLPLRICHNDTKLNNILFSKTTDKALCLIDLDTLMPGYFYYDFGDVIRTLANPAQEDERDLDKIAFSQPFFSAFINGLASIATFLKEEELESLPHGAVFMPFIHGLRALTDYLENDRYYKTAYPTQNLDRAKSLFEFARKANAEKSFMQQYIAQAFQAKK